MRSAATLLTVAPVLLLIAGCLQAEIETAAKPEASAEADPFDPEHPSDKSGERTQSIVIETKFIEITSGTEELAFDWIVEPVSLFKKSSTDH
jgi:hypothetical protein